MLVPKTGEAAVQPLLLAAPPPPHMFQHFNENLVNILKEHLESLE